MIWKNCAFIAEIWSKMINNRGKLWVYSISHLNQLNTRCANGKVLMTLTESRAIKNGDCHWVTH